MENKSALKNKKPRNKTATPLKWILPVAACLIIAVVITIPLLNNSSNNNSQDFEPLFIGLPVNNFSLSELHTNVSYDRWAYTKPSDFFSQYNGVPDIFVFARVLDTEQIDETPRYLASNTIRKNSSAQILSVIWSRDGSMPETLPIAQYLYGGCCADEPTNLLREGGVYLLPLVYWKYTDTWRIADDLDVLFEVDDKGCVWSHSAYEGFKRFDGNDVNILVNELTAMISDENFFAAVSRFGLIVRGNGSVLMEVTHLSVTSKKNILAHTENEYYEHAFRVEKILSTPAERFPSYDAGDEIKAISYDSITKIHLEINGRYLIFYYPDEEGLQQIGTGDTAKINGDGTITEVFTPPDYSHRAFEGYNGYTVAQMEEEAKRAKAWQDTHVK